LAVLAKGPAAIILCGGAIFFWALLAKRWRDAFRLLHPVAILAFCATALPWYVICARRNPDFFRVFIVEHNFKRYLTAEFQHVQPIWYYAPVLLVAFLPWMGVFLWSAVVGTREIFRRRTVSDVTLLLTCWAAFCVIFFSASHSKLPGYILPAFPPIGFLLARSVVSLGVARERSFRYAHFAAAAVFLLLCVGAEMFSRGRSASAALLAGLGGAVLLLFAVANLILGLVAAAHGQKRSGPLAAWAVAPILLAILFTGVSAKYLLRGFRLSNPSANTIALEVQKRRVPATQLFVANMNRSLRYGLSFYLHGEVRNWEQQSGTGGYLLLGSKSCERIVGSGLYCEPQPFDLNSTGRFLYLVIPIAPDKAR
jgi:4-amino-4-deoxy-L-arabinose transferase-like glycosyltransferase